MIYLHSHMPDLDLIVDVQMRGQINDAAAAFVVLDY